MNPTDIRRHILRMAMAGNSCHLGPALSVVEILVALYDHILQPGDELLIGKGHAAMAQWACLYDQGKLGDADLDGYLSDGSKLLGSVETGSALGHALSVGVGMALGQQYSRAWKTMNAATDSRTFVIVGDGELNEGACWEAIMTAAQWTLGNLTVIVDQNGYQAMGATQDVLDLSPLKAKFEAFGWAARDVQDGNDVASVGWWVNRLAAEGPERDKPKALICRTTKGAGVPFMAHDNEWHYARLTPDLYDLALKHLNTERKVEL